MVNGATSTRMFVPRRAQSENPKSEARNPKQYQIINLLMFKTFNKRSGISRKDENPSP
jgi:hypothetical protein